MARRGATTRDPKVKMERLSPGVYRSAQGGLVGNKGQALPSQQPLQRQPMQKPMPASPYQPAPLPTGTNANGYTPQPIMNGIVPPPKGY